MIINKKVGNIMGTNVITARTGIKNLNNFHVEEIQDSEESYLKIENKLQKLMEEAKAFLSSNLDNHIDIHLFCKIKGISYTNFRLKFKKHFGISPHQYRIGTKMQIAEAHLKYSDITVKKISAMLGYATPFEFSNYFKKYYGLAPIKYRQQHSKK